MRHAENIQSKMSKDASIGWMYDGAKGNVHREDYLLGKSLDKNFEKYSDVVNTQKAEAIDTIVGTRAVFNGVQSTGLKTSSLQKDIIKSEDPFVAVKVREETKRREFMDNPLMKLKIQNALKGMMTAKSAKEKKPKKDKKKKKKKRRSRSSSSDSSEEDVSSRKEKRRDRSSSPKRRRSSDRSEEPRSLGRNVSNGDRRRKDSDRKRQLSPSPKRKRRAVDRDEDNRHSRRRDASADRRKEGADRKRKRSPSPKRNEKARDRSRDDRGLKRRDSSGDRGREWKETRKSRSRSTENRRNHRHHSSDAGCDRRMNKRKSRSRSVEKSSSKRQRSRSLRRDRSRSIGESRRREKSRSATAERIRRESKSPQRSPSNNPYKQHLSRLDSSTLSQGASFRSPSADKPETSNRQYDSHVPRHLQHQSQSSDSEPGLSRKTEDKRRYDDEDKEDGNKKSYGLVEMRKRTAEEREKEAKGPSEKYKLIKIPTGRGPNQPREPRKALTDEERAARLAEMQDNAKWRDEIREKNVEKTRVEDEEEKIEADKGGYAPSFIRNQMREACDDMTVEKRLQSNKRGVQRAHGYMDRSFAKK